MLFTVLLGLTLAHIGLYIIYMPFTASIGSAFSTYNVSYICLLQPLSGLSLGHIVLCGIYMLFTASIRSVFSTYRVNLYQYVYFLQPLLGLPVAHIELIIHAYRYMPFYSL